MLLDFYVIQMFCYIKILVLAAALKALKWPRFLVISMLRFFGLQWPFFKLILKAEFLTFSTQWSTIKIILFLASDKWVAAG